uniref:HEAT repeat-containing protein 1 n=1 Tax=Parascaris univalens TaxID=6257 RepID=A0A914ZZH0_PARUN
MDWRNVESAESFLGMVNALKIMKKLSRDVLDMYAKVIIASTTPVLLKVNKDGNGRFAFVCGHVECLGQAIRHERYFLRLRRNCAVGAAYREQQKSAEFQHSRVHRQITLPNGGTRSVLQDGAALRAYHGNVPLLRSPIEYSAVVSTRSEMLRDR